MRILVIATLYPLSVDDFHGQARHVNLRELCRQGHEIQVLRSQCYFPSLFAPCHWRRQGRPKAPHSYVLEGVPVCCPRYWRLPGKWWRAYEGGWQYRGCAAAAAAGHDRKPFDIIYGSQLLPEGMTALLLGRDLNIPIIVGSIGSDAHTYPYQMRSNYRATRWVLANADAVIVEGGSKALEAVRRIGPEGLSVRIFNRGIDLGRFRGLGDRREIRTRFALPLDRRFIVFVGNLAEGKGVRVLLQAFDELHRGFADVDLVFVGSGPLAGRIDRFASEQGWRERVHMLGRQSFQEVPQIMSAGDIFCLPSFAEGLSKAVVEAMASGLPVVTTTVGALQDVIADGSTGLLVPPRNEVKLKAALEKLLASPVEATRMGEAARAVAFQRYDAATNAAELVRLAEEVIERPRAFRGGQRQSEWSTVDAPGDRVR